MSDILRKQNRMINCPAVTAGQIPYRNVTVKDKLDELDNRASANIFDTSRVDITSYTSANPYECPSDGYVYLEAQASSDAYAVVGAKDSSGSTFTLYFSAKNSANPYASYFVKKGFKLFKYSKVGSSYMLFIPLEGSALPSAESEGF